MKTSRVHWMRLYRMLLTVSLAWGAFVSAAQAVQVPDPELEKVIRVALEKPEGEITRADMESLTELSIRPVALESLSGLENAINLTDLRIHDNEISDLGPLGGLVKLERLWLSDNEVSDLSPLAGLTRLRWLRIRNNRVRDLEPLAALASLQHLDLAQNAVRDVGPLAHLEGLVSLYLFDNQITDILPLAQLPNLRDQPGWGHTSPGLMLHDNYIDISEDSPGRQVIRNLNGTPGLNVYWRNQRDPQSRPVSIPDSNLEEAIRAAIEKPEGEITAGHLESLTVLAADLPWDENGVSELSDLTGLENATNLVEIRLSGYRVADISPLAGLIELKVLELDSRPDWVMDHVLKDLTPLAGLTGLTRLSLETVIGDVDLGPLAGLVHLTELDLNFLFYSGSDQSNSFGIEPLSGLTHLEKLSLTGFNRCDITPLAELSNLKELSLARTPIGDLSPIAELKKLTRLNLNSVRVSDISFLSGLTALTSLDLERNEIGDLAPLAGLNRLNFLNLKGNYVSDISSLARLTDLTVLELSGTAISDLGPLSELVHLELLNLSNSEVRGIGPLAKLTNLTVLDLRSNAISDLGPLSELIHLHSLDLSRNDIGDISPLAKLTGLTVLDLGGNAISDLGPLSELTDLGSLDLRGNGASDIGPLAHLTGLTVLSLGGNGISDLGPLAGLTDMKTLDLWYSNVSDPRPLSGLVNLTSLDLSLNQITDLSPLANLINLEWIGLWGNRISDLSPLAKLTNLTGLDLEQNTISDLGPLVGLSKLRGLDLRSNHIRDVGPLAELKDLTGLDLSWNWISDPGPLAGLTQLNDHDRIERSPGYRCPCADGLGLRGNYINISPGSSARQVIDRLNAMEDLTVVFEPQKDKQNEPVWMFDPNLESAVRIALEKGSGDITAADMERLTHLSAPQRKISDLYGLEFAINLVELDLAGNQISDIGRLAGLTNLKKLDLSHNQITYIGPLLGMNKLDSLELSGNLINIAPGSSSRAIIDAHSARPGVSTGFERQRSLDVSTRLANMSTRGQVLPGSGALIMGFAVEGKGEKEVMIRGVGPTLEQWLTGVCSRPELELHRYSDSWNRAMASNRGWGLLEEDVQGISQRVGAFALAQQGEDAVLIMNLQPGVYTATMSGLGAEGLGLLELYDADLDPLRSTSRLANISTRGEVGTGDQILIAGLVVSGVESKQVLIRGIGPKLGDFGVDGALTDPHLTIFRNADPDPFWVAFNDNWSDNLNETDIVVTTMAEGGFALDAGSKDAVILTWLEPGSYTAQVSGVDGDTGVALIEVYEVE